MKKILYATDFSACADNALTYAIRLAEKINAKIILHHSCQSQIFATEIPLEGMKDETILKNATDSLRKYTHKEAFKKGKIAFEEDICFGDAADNIIRLAGKEQPDFIVMGTTGTNSLMKKLIGSTASKVIEKVMCPVLIIPEKAMHQNLRKVIYAADYRSVDIAHIKATAALAKLFDAEMIIVHMSLVGYTDNLERETFKLFQDEVTSKVDYNKLSFQLQIGLNVDEVLEAVVNDEHADLLVLSVRHTNLIEKFFSANITQKMIHHTRIPILTFKTN